MIQIILNIIIDILNVILNASIRYQSIIVIFILFLSGLIYKNRVEMSQLLRYKIAWHQYTIFVDSVQPIIEYFKSDYNKCLQEEIEKGTIDLTPTEIYQVTNRHGELLEVCFNSVYPHVRTKLLSNHIPKPSYTKCHSKNCVNCNKIDCFALMTYVRGMVYQLSQLVWSTYRLRYDDSYFPLKLSDREKRYKNGEIMSEEDMVNEFRKLCIRWYNIAHPKKKRIWDNIFNKNNI